MPGLIEPSDDVKIQLAGIVGFNTMDQCDSVPQELLDFVNDNWSASLTDILKTGIVTAEQLLALGATKIN